MRVDDYFIWWLSQGDCEILEGHIHDLDLPEYIIDNFMSRYGRAGRGRLWSIQGLDIEVAWGEKITHKLAEKCGGLVCSVNDIDKVVFLPGFITTLEMEFWITVDENLRYLGLRERDKKVHEDHPNVP